MPNPSRRPEFTPRPDLVRARVALARKWTYLLIGVVVVPLSREELDRELRDQLDLLCDALHAEPFDLRLLEQVGERLVALGYVGHAGLRCTAEVLGKGLLALPEFQPTDRYAERIVLGIGAMACGFADANSRSIFEQQQSMQMSLLKAVRDANWSLKQSEARFDEVATSSTSGIMIVDLNGRLVRANDALGDILGYGADELAGIALLDLAAPDSAEFLRDAMAVLLDGGKDRVRQSQRMLRKDGDVARLTLTASLLRGEDDGTGHFVVVVEDGTELALLQGELNRQALHDVLTGLPNRQFFSTQLETAVRRADPEHGVTVFHLDIDAFGMVCNSLGGRVGERLLQHVAQRLKSVLSHEKAMIARFDGDEFGILLENSATTPGIATIMKNINEDLAEPTYVDGHGLAVSVSAGIVDRPGPGLEPAELLRAADLTLRRAKVARRGQWEQFHHAQDAEDRRDHALAVVMPGAWEHGEIGVRYRPIAHIETGSLTGVEASLRWDRPGIAPLNHDRCAALAEETGLILPLGEWLLRIVSGQAVWWRQREQFDRLLALRLTQHQSTDADLVSRVVGVLEETGLKAEHLMISMPVGVLPIADAADNLTVLADMGVYTVLDDFGLGPLDLRAVTDLPVKSVRVARGLVESQAPYVTGLMPLVRESGVTIAVDGIDSAEQAEWWRAAGADFATGDFYGTASTPGEFVEKLEPR
ncbi:diguanylate cyclase [Lentzea tibetensis]|uniref:Diguanylate cyclase n=1 Tax=Lentzea tibetensis TaxID=2591470 RepID=A0A563EPS1_9PSEU|nr:diguanylate cyclase [Lentzea tibetensis]TWP49335.1 diguanylate cyclase [Lentzea tibetensis]